MEEGIERKKLTREAKKIERVLCLFSSICFAVERIKRVLKSVRVRESEGRGGPDMTMQQHVRASRALDSRGCPESFARTLYQDITDIVFKKNNSFFYNFKCIVLI